MNSSINDEDSKCDAMFSYTKSASSILIYENITLCACV